MTVSTSVGRQFTITEICLLAYQSVGLMSVQQGTEDATWGKRFQFASRMLELIVDELATHNIIARARDFYEIDITSANVTDKEFKFTLPADILDVVHPAMYIPASETDTERAEGETFIRVVTQGEYQTLGNKGGTGQPTWLYPDRTGDQIVVRLWQIPDEAGTVRLIVHRKLADADDGNSTLDLDEYWINYIVTALSAKLAQAHNLPIAAQQQLQASSAQSRDLAKGKAGQRGAIQVRLNHTTRWSGKRLTS
jgi:hypothetical protein